MPSSPTYHRPKVPKRGSVTAGVVETATGQKGGALMGDTKSKSWGQGFPVGTRVRVQVGLSAGQLGEVADVYGDAHRPPVAPFRWYGVRLANGLRPLYRHDELKPVH